MTRRWTLAVHSDGSVIADPSLKPGESHEAALACEAVEASSRCTCGGYFVDGEVVHDGLCDAFDEDVCALHVGQELLLQGGETVTAGR